MSLEAVIKEMSMGEIDELITAAEFMGPAALPFALSAYNFNKVMKALKAEKQARLSFPQIPFSTTHTGFGVRDDLIRSGASALEAERARRAAAAGEPVEVQKPVDEAKEPEARAGVGESGIRQRHVGHAGVDEPTAGESQAAIARGLRDVDIEEPVREDPVREDPVERVRVPRLTRAAVGIAGAAGVTAMIENLWPGSKVVKQNPDGTVTVRSPDGKTHRLNPSVLQGVRGRGASGLTNGSTGFEYFIKNKYRTPRSGRWDSRLFNRYTRVASQHANPSAMDKQVMGIPQLARTTGRRVELVRPVPRAGGLI